MFFVVQNAFVSRDLPGPAGRAYTAALPIEEEQGMKLKEAQEGRETTH